MKSKVLSICTAGVMAITPPLFAEKNPNPWGDNPFTTNTSEPVVTSGEKACINPSTRDSFMADLSTDLIGRQQELVRRAQHASNSVIDMANTSGKSPMEIIAMQKSIAETIQLASTLSHEIYILSTMISDYNKNYGKFCGLDLPENK